MQTFSHKPLALLLAAVLLQGCAASADRFYRDSASISNAQLCRTLRTAGEGSDPVFASDVRRAAEARGLNDAACQSLVSRQNSTIAAAGVIGVALVGLASRSNNVGVGVGVGVGLGGGGEYRVADSDWDWDEFSTPTHERMWGCRGIQSGQLVDPAQCAGKVQTDWRWPQK
ncbi:hypothetical protein [Massilia sp. CF038]|uniref:hypothetical protein n=1 Tax=Massilia sp. CF038 TaxID=1881045 RepID=UPI0009130E25|nr:hypothetical protein [Massilia sp. CF038]SHH04817.1 hypothetical protein SAMN05428948_2502 [Massilia sp. CF038]